jgi:hypothetical protein
MRFIILCCLIVLLLVTTIPATGNMSQNCIKGGPHDLSSKGASSSFGDSVEQAGLDRVCVYCHTGHLAIEVSAQNAAANYLPLWNHTLSNTQFAQYNNGTTSQISGISVLCMSCHDGSIATNSFGANQTSPQQRSGGATHYISSSNPAYLGGDATLSNSHPIGFNYAFIQASEPDIAPSSNAMGTTGQTIGDFLDNGIMTCATCHEVHGCNISSSLTVVTDSQSAFCLTCHLK